MNKWYKLIAIAPVTRIETELDIGVKDLMTNFPPVGVVDGTFYGSVMWTVYSILQGLGLEDSLFLSGSSTSHVPHFSKATIAADIKDCPVDFDFHVHCTRQLFEAFKKKLKSSHGIKAFHFLDCKHHILAHVKYADPSFSGVDLTFHFKPFDPVFTAWDIQFRGHTLSRHPQQTEDFNQGLLKFSSTSDTKDSLYVPKDGSLFLKLLKLFSQFKVIAEPTGIERILIAFIKDESMCGKEGSNYVIQPSILGYLSRQVARFCQSLDVDQTWASLDTLVDAIVNSLVLRNKSCLSVKDQLMNLFSSNEFMDPYRKSSDDYWLLRLSAGKSFCRELIEMEFNCIKRLRRAPFDPSIFKLEPQLKPQPSCVSSRASRLSSHQAVGKQDSASDSMSENSDVSKDFPIELTSHSQVSTVKKSQQERTHETHLRKVALIRLWVKSELSDLGNSVISKVEALFLNTSDDNLSWVQAYNRGYVSICRQLLDKVSHSKGFSNQTETDLVLEAIRSAMIGVAFNVANNDGELVAFSTYFLDNKRSFTTQQREIVCLKTLAYCFESSQPSKVKGPLRNLITYMTKVSYKVDIYSSFEFQKQLDSGDFSPKLKQGLEKFIRKNEFLHRVYLRDAFLISALIFFMAAYVRKPTFDAIGLGFMILCWTKTLYDGQYLNH